MKRFFSYCLALMCASYSLSAQVVVTPDVELGPIKRMNAVKVSLAKGKFDENVRCHITDDFNMYTEYPVALQPDGTLLLTMEPNSFVFIEF